MIWLFLAEGFEETEAIAPADCLRRAGKDVRLVGVGGTVIRGAHGIAVETDCTAQSLTPDDSLEMMILPGGMPGTRNLDSSPAVDAALRWCAEHDRYIAAICAAPSVPGKRGLLKGKKATCYPGFEEYLLGAETVAVPAVRDGRFITGRGPGAALDFGLLLVETLCGRETRDKLAQGMVYDR